MIPYTQTRNGCSTSPYTNLDNRHDEPYQPNHFILFLIDITHFQFDIEPTGTEANKTNNPGGRDQYGEPLKENDDKSEETKTQEEHSSGGELPKDEHTSEEPKPQEENSSGGELPEDRTASKEPKTQEEHSCGGELPNKETTSEESKSKEEHSSSGNCQKIIIIIIIILFES